MIFCHSLIHIRLSYIILLFIVITTNNTYLFYSNSYNSIKYPRDR